MKRLHCCPRGDGGSTSTGSKVRLHQASTWGHVSRRGVGRRDLFIKVVALIDLRGHGQGGKQIRGESSFVAAALFKMDAGWPYGMLA